MTLDIPLFKIFRRPLIPIQESWVDAFPIIAIFILFAAATFLLLFFKKKALARRIVQVLAFFTFVILIHRCLCLIRGWAFGIIEIGRDDLRAFENLCMFVPIFGLSLLLGRIFCGWICPLGFLQEVAGSLTRKKGRKSLRSPIIFFILLTGSIIYLYFFRPTTDFFTENTAAIWSMMLLIILIYLWFIPSSQTERLKYYSLIGWIILGIAGVFLTSPWCIMYGNELDYSAFLALLVVTAVAVVHSQAWCRYLCPLGGLLSLLARFGSVIELKSNTCRNCSIEDCNLICPTGALTKEGINTSECILCGRCIENCNIEVGICR
ncbi:MAG TPA: 4Fe-4S binding protein [Candidatus Omnitrophica bacterium]|nr:4Fe-4S binding protein [Candidatus Omnitrophota bacterium]